MWFVDIPFIVHLQQNSLKSLFISVYHPASAQYVLLWKVNGLILEHSLGSVSSSFGLLNNPAMISKRDLKQLFTSILSGLFFFFFRISYISAYLYRFLLFPLSLLVHPGPSPSCINDLFFSNNS